MILLSSNAEHIFWLGRYLARTQFLCAHFPFLEDEAAVAYAHAFCLPAFDASSLNELVLDPAQPYSFHQQFKIAKDNIQELRGILSAKAYAELNRLIKTADQNAGYICDVVPDCQDILEGESPGIFLFFSLGQCLEQLDQQMRLGESTAVTISKVDYVIETLVQMGWNDLKEYWDQLRKNTDLNNFYQFSDYIHHMFENNV
ncbi:alpha-E domain-containing protein [Acinetobacter thermotolerans]|uniref:alpha-E domain-containing protein n=1 Tax=Acinetobacter thermotolerans TaxID=3151487 RepID=UPI00325C160E